MKNETLMCIQCHQTILKYLQPYKRAGRQFCDMKCKTAYGTPEEVRNKISMTKKTRYPSFLDSPKAWPLRKKREQFENAISPEQQREATENYTIKEERLLWKFYWEYRHNRYLFRSRYEETIYKFAEKLNNRPFLNNKSNNENN